MGCVVGSLACCVGTAACSLCCKACPSCKNSTSTRIAYAMIMLVGVIIACILLAPGLYDLLKKVGLPKSDFKICLQLVGVITCHDLCKESRSGSRVFLGFSRWGRV